MQSKRSLILDLNNLFSPAISDGLARLSDFEKDFSQIHMATKTLKQLGHLPYAKLPSDDILYENIKIMAERHGSVQNVVVFGIGGSALGAASIYQALRGAHANLKTDNKNPRLFVVDHIEPDTMHDVLEVVRDQINLYVFISKSGNTSETLAQLLWLEKSGIKLTQENAFFITDANEGVMREIALKGEYDCLPVPSGVGGRFSVFTAVGLLPLAVAGFDIKALMLGAKHMESLCLNDILAQNPAGLLAMSLHAWQDKGAPHVVMMPYSDRLRLFADWFAQLWGESLGKAKSLQGKDIHVGGTPIKSVGVTDQHSQVQLYLEGPRDKVVAFVEVEEFQSPGVLGNSSLADERISFLNSRTLSELQQAEKVATEECLREKNRPNLTIRLSMINEYQIGQIYQLMMNVIPYMGALLNINPYDQPAVERIKKFTFGLMGRKGYEDFAYKLKDQVKDKGLIF